MSTHDRDWVRQLFSDLVPAIAAGDIEIKGLARAPGILSIMPESW